MAIFDADVQVIAREEIIKKEYDINLNSNVVLGRMIQAGKTWSSGFKLDTIFNHTKSTQGGVSGIGAKLNTGRDNTTARMTFDPKRITQPVVADYLETTLNGGAMQVLDLETQLIQRAVKDMFSDLGDQLYGGTGTGDQWNSLINAADDGTNYATYGGQSRTTYPDLNGYLVTGVGAITLANLATAYNAVEHGEQTPSLIATTKSVWATFEAIGQLTQQAIYNAQSGPQKLTVMKGLQPGNSYNVGAVALVYRGTPFIKDEKAQSGRVYLINENYFSFYNVDITAAVKGGKKIKFDGSKIDTAQTVPNTEGFGFTGMMAPYDYLAEIGHVYMHGNFISPNPRLQGQMQGVT